MHANSLIKMLNSAGLHVDLAGTSSTLEGERPRGALSADSAVLSAVHLAHSGLVSAD